MAKVIIKYLYVKQGGGCYVFIWIDDFIPKCESRGWIVNPINVVNRIEVYNKANEEIRLE